MPILGISPRNALEMAHGGRGIQVIVKLKYRYHSVQRWRTGAGTSSHYVIFVFAL
jgi:hypothetical protein